MSLSTDNGFDVSRWGTWGPGTRQNVMVGDFNRDGRSDLAAMLGADWWVFLSDETELIPGESWGSWPAGPTWSNVKAGYFR